MNFKVGDAHLVIRKVDRLFQSAWMKRNFQLRQSTFDCRNKVIFSTRQNRVATRVFERLSINNFKQNVSR